MIMVVETEEAKDNVVRRPVPQPVSARKMVGGCGLVLEGRFGGVEKGYL
jgi:hypothetical protein